MSFGQRILITRGLFFSLGMTQHVQTLSQVFIPRDARHSENLDRVANYIRQGFESAKAEVSEQPYEVNGTTYKNVIATFGPDSKERI
ncbi:MAG TPA: hypothetical protein VHK86_01090, partial [Nitrososphaera sp.]|nr:hypothetical protein [Nitrososphaera sp.]